MPTWLIIDRASFLFYMNPCRGASHRLALRYLLPTLFHTANWAVQFLIALNFEVNCFLFKYFSFNVVTKIGQIGLFSICFELDGIFDFCCLRQIKTSQKELIESKNKTNWIEANNLTWFAAKSQILSQNFDTWN